MKYHGTEVKSLQHIARCMILNQLIDLEDAIVMTEFGDLDIRSPIAKELLKREVGIEMSHIESLEFLAQLRFEIAKLIGKLEHQTGVITGKVHRTTGHVVYKGAYVKEVHQEYLRSGNAPEVSIERKTKL